MKLPIGSAQQFTRVARALLAFSSVIALALLGASLTGLKLRPAQMFFSRELPRSVFIEFDRVVQSASNISVGEALLLVGGILLIFVLVMMMLSPEMRKQLIKTILRIGLTAWAIFYVLTRFQAQGGLEVDPQLATTEQTQQIVSALPPYTPPAIPNVVVYLVSLTVVLVFVGVGFVIYRVIRPPSRPLVDLARAARSALKDLSSGRRWDDTVISCYIRMSAAVSEQRGLHRQSATTPAEFARRLEQAGLPTDPVRRLTRLFEKARYGNSPSSPNEVNEAVACLVSILQSVGVEQL